MAEAIRRNEWDQTAWICKTIADVNRGANTAPYPVSHFQPMHGSSPVPPPAREVIEGLASVFEGLQQMRGQP
jgi:hypothetical protein